MVLGWMRSASVVTGDGEQVAHEAGDYGLVSRALGGLPIVNHFLDRLGLPGLLNEALGEVDGCTKLAPASAIRLVITNLVLGREPLYALGEWAARYDPALLGLSGEEAETINDDRVGRALDALFHADRASLLTIVMLAAIGEFRVDTDQLHNNSTSISVHGTYRAADGSPRRGNATPVITHGHSKDVGALRWVVDGPLNFAQVDLPGLKGFMPAAIAAILVVDFIY